MLNEDEDVVLLQHLHPENWTWVDEQNPDLRFDWQERSVLFHPNFSFGASMVRGEKPLTENTIAYWEVVCCQDLYGTSVQFGVGPADLVNRLPFLFTHLIGMDATSYALSHTGDIQSAGISANFCPPLNTKKPTIGILFNGPARTISYFQDGHFLGTPFARVDVSYPLFPLVASTAQQSKFQLGVQKFRCEARSLLRIAAERVLGLVDGPSLWKSEEEAKSLREKVEDGIVALQLPRHLHSQLKMMKHERRFHHHALVQQRFLARRRFVRAVKQDGLCRREVDAAGQERHVASIILNYLREDL